MRDLNPNEPTVKAAAFAVKIEDFWKSDIGAHLTMHCQAEIEANTRHLVEHAHELDKDQIRDCQTAIWRASKFHQWLAEAYENGLAALRALEGEEHESD